MAVFGNDSDFPNEVGVFPANILRGTRFALPDYAHTTTISARVKSTSGTTVFRLGVWAVNASNVPTTLLGITDALSTASASYVTVSGPLVLTLSPANYLLAIWCKDIVLMMAIHDNVGVEWDGFNAPWDDTATTGLSPWPNSGGPFARTYGFWVTYDAFTPSGPADNVPHLLAGRGASW